MTAPRDMLGGREVAVPGYGWRTHGPGVAVIALLLAVYVAGFHLLDISFARFIPGLNRLGDIVGLMLPPTPETFSRFLVYLDALGQTLAIAFLAPSPPRSLPSPSASSPRATSSPAGSCISSPAEGLIPCAASIPWYGR